MLSRTQLRSCPVKITPIIVDIHNLSQSDVFVVFIDEQMAHKDE